MRCIVPITAATATATACCYCLPLLLLLHLCRELDLSDCCSITDAALGPLSRFQRALPPPAPEDSAPDASTSTEAVPATPSTPHPAASAAVPATPASVGPGSGVTPGPGVHYGELTRYGSNSFATPQGVAGAADGYAHAAARGAGPRGTGGKTGGWDKGAGRGTAGEGSTGLMGDEEEDEDLRRAMFESLAMLAASPTTTGLGSLGSIQAALAGVALGSVGAVSQTGGEGRGGDTTPVVRRVGLGANHTRRVSGLSGRSGSRVQGDSDVEGGSESGSEGEEEEEEEVLLDEDLAARDAREAERSAREAERFTREGERSAQGAERVSSLAGDGVGGVPHSIPTAAVLGTPPALSRRTTADDMLHGSHGSNGPHHHAIGVPPLPPHSAHGFSAAGSLGASASAPRTASTPATIPRPPNRATHSHFYGASPPTHSPYLVSGPPILGASPPAGASPLLGSSPIARSLGSSAGKAGGMHHVGSFGKGSFSKLTRAVGLGDAATDAGAEGTEGTGEGSSTSTSTSGGRGLEVLSLAGCSRISADGVRTLLAAPLVKKCLRALDISRCSRVTRAALLLPPTVGCFGLMYVLEGHILNLDACLRGCHLEIRCDPSRHKPVLIRARLA